MNKILTLDDLHRFYSSKGKKVHFNAKDEDHRIIVSVPGKIDFAKEEDSKEGLRSVKLQACHTGPNINGSQISDEVMAAALPSFSNRPILAYIYQDDNGDYQFRDHTMHMEEDILVYDEAPVGIVPESAEAHLEYDEDKDKNYVVVNGYLFEEYSKAVEILEREQECSVSVELSIREMSYDANEDLLNIDEFYFSGVTLLGRFEDGTKVLPGMQGSNIRLADFQQKNQYSYSQDEVIAMLDEINSKIDQLTIDKSRKEEKSHMEFDQNAKVTDEPVTEEFAGTESIEESSEDVVVEESNEESAIVTEAKAEDTDEVTPPDTETFGAEETEEVEEAEETSEDETEDTTEESEYSLKMSVILGEKTYERYASLNAIVNSLTELVNDTYAEDGTFYAVEAYDDGTAKSRYLIMQDLWSGAGYKQAYTNKDGVLSLKGEREPVTYEWLTASEKTELESMRANYSSIQNKLAQYKAEPEKLEVLNSDRYDLVRDQEEFVALSQREAYFDLSTDEVKEKADKILLEYAASGLKENFAAHTSEEKKTVARKAFSIIPKKKNYGSLLNV